MRENDRLLYLSDFPAALSLLSRWPLRASMASLSRGAQTAWCWPLVGLVLAGLAALLAVIAQALGVPPAIAALLALSLMVLQTGALHEDGLADVADGFWGGATPARRLEIMKDSAIGSYGTLALILSLGLRGAALISLTDHLAIALLTSAILSRGAMVAIMHALPPARPNGLSAQTGRPSLETVLIALGLSAVLTLLLIGWSAFWLLLITGLAGVFVAKIALAKINGQTGDVLGASQQIIEIAMLISLTCLL